jgi:hypothetical protein
MSMRAIEVCLPCKGRSLVSVINRLLEIEEVVQHGHPKMLEAPPQSQLKAS